MQRRPGARTGWGSSSGNRGSKDSNGIRRPLMQPRQAISFLRGPMTRAEIRKGCEWRAEVGREPELAAAAE